MYRFFINSGQVSGGFVSIEGADAHHMRDVLRMQPGEEVEAADEQGNVYACRVGSLDTDEVRLEVLKVGVSENELPVAVTLCVGLPKFEKMELIVQKAVELGAARIVPVAMKRSVVKLDEKKAKSKVARWQAIAEAAAKQSKRGIIPEVGDVVPLKTALREAAAAGRILLPYECAEGIEKTREILGSFRPGEAVTIFIGPEGGFGLDEVEAAKEAGAEIVTLGRRILRVETAAITAMALVMFYTER